MILPIETRIIAFITIFVIVTVAVLVAKLIGRVLKNFAQLQERNETEYERSLETINELKREWEEGK